MHGGTFARLDSGAASPRNYKALVGSIILAGYLLLFFLGIGPILGPLVELELRIRKIPTTTNTVIITRENYLEFEIDKIRGN